MKNNTFLKIITIFVTFAFVLEMIPSQAFAFNASYPVGMSSAWAERANSPTTWKYICSWGINPPGYKPDIGVGKEIFGPTFAHSGGYDSHEEGYYQDGILSSPTAPTTIAYFNVQKHEYQYTEYSLKTTGYLNKVSNKAQQALYYGKPSCCPDGKSYSDKCKTGTTKECLVTYCLSNLSDCNQVQKTATYYTYNKIDETTGGTFYSSKIIDPNATPLQAEITTRTGGNTRMTIPDGEIVGCGSRKVSTYNYETKTCPVGISVNTNTPIKLPDGTTSDLCKMLYNGRSYGSYCQHWLTQGNQWSQHIFVSTVSPVQTILVPGSSIKTNQNVANPQEVVKSFAWVSSGCDLDKGEGPWPFNSTNTYYCHKGLRANYLTADGSTSDRHSWWTKKKSVANPLGIISIILGDPMLTFIGTLFMHDFSISSVLSDNDEISLCSVPSVPPQTIFAIAGADKLVDEGGSVDFSLNGPATVTNPSGGSLIYTWNYSPVGGNLNDSRVLNPTYYAPTNVDANTTYTFTLTAKNTSGLSSSDSLNVTVNDLARISVSPSSYTMKVGDPPKQFIAYFDCDGPNPYCSGQGQDVTTSSTWTTDSSIIIVDNSLAYIKSIIQQALAASYSKGMVTAVKAGTADVKATYNGKFGYARVKVVETPPPPPPTAPLPTCDYFTANPSTIINSGKSTLSWGSTNAVSCTINNGIATGTNISGTRSTPQLDITTTYRLTCTNTGGQCFKDAKVTVLKSGYCEINPSGDGCE